jgi:hypothetical protein
MTGRIWQRSDRRGAAPSGPTIRWTLDLAGTPVALDRIARARAKAPGALVEGRYSSRSGLDTATSVLRHPYCGHRMVGR